MGERFSLCLIQDGIPSRRLNRKWQSFRPAKASDDFTVGRSIDKVSTAAGT